MYRSVADSDDDDSVLVVTGVAAGMKVQLIQL